MCVCNFMYIGLSSLAASAIAVASGVWPREIARLGSRSDVGDEILVFPLAGT